MTFIGKHKFFSVTCVVQKNRNRWTSGEKVEIVRFAKEHGQATAAAHFGVSRRSIYLWSNPDKQQEERKKVSNNLKIKEANRKRAKKNYDKDPSSHNQRAKDSRRKRRFKRLVEMSNRFFDISQYLTAFDLWCIAKRQKLLCALTGEKLTNETISVDHIIPKSQGGSNKRENIRLVHKDANLARRALSDKQFLELCKKVVSHLDSRP